MLGAFYLGQSYLGQGSAETSTVVMICASIELDAQVIGIPEIADC